MAMHEDPVASSTGIKVIIVGFGIAGASAAIECHRKGHNVVVYERLPELTKVGGDGISLGSNGCSVLSKWDNGEFNETIKPLKFRTDNMNIFDYTGFDLGKHKFHGYNAGRGYTLNRGSLVFSMYDYAQKLGIKVFMGSTVTEYWETEDEAGIVVNGEKVAADCVICAEGIHSKGRAAITGQEMQCKETGFVSTRGYLEGKAAIQGPSLTRIVSGMEDGNCMYGWMGPRMHISMGIKIDGGELFWYACHEAASVPPKNNSEAIDHILECMSDWTMRDELESVVRNVSEGRFISQKLVVTTALKSWLSPRRRMIVIGDAAHAALPTSGQGGTQAIEDAAVLAIALELAGKQDIPLALSVTEKIRFKRAQLIQQGGLAVLKFGMNRSDFELFRKDPNLARPPHPAWIFDHDCQEYTYREFAAAAEAVRSGKDYVPTNIPADGEYRIAYDSK
ncbi:uncharacterized protein CIMG_07299 [Coccidioides immitis RS]|uniref:FAD-binding domain-containing protein n=3 Tax=Coccidioides immitis TaxID=5501 RepID=J3KA16_COCIM|nr:uncharacterized protein CIMG_07299 [Coccidioides immitis RS]EAS31820.3 hypothetical protein CIMG_07299 [Coccidioides immitis RS]KMP02413.1 hypothetical protein CIRG_10236 [Coccidioides immitis RMSCC 2394]KMU76683.1 hypothetical protein CISG_05826 [Coccidioides immitis RMSCC 3703]TPX24534.1 hypothetical protein DIZ76_013881 [Coccidioides immitis]